MKEKHYKQVWIESEDDLPEEGMYHTDKGEKYFNPDRESKSFNEWMTDIDWYLKPVEPKGLTDEEITNSRPYLEKEASTPQMWKNIGFIMGAKWARDQIQGNRREELINYSRWSEKYWNIITDHKEKVDKYLKTNK